MAINIKFDLAGNPEPPTIILANRSGNKLGQLDVNVKSIDLSDKFNDASEFSFTINKYIDGRLTNLWDKVVDFKLVYCKEWNMWFEIKVELDEATETIKTVYCTQLGQAELSQIMLYNIEINTEEDISRDDYKISILYDESNPEASILHRILSKAPHYSIAHVDETLKRIQRSFSFDDSSICDALDEVEEEIGCLVVYDSNSDKNGMPQRIISVYDLQQNCNKCSHRGEFTDICPKCGGTDITNGYGEDTLIFVTSDELATEGIELVTDTDSVKNCFKLEAGDDLMTATIRNCNPNGTDYIWYFSNSIKEDMSKDLVKKIEDYDVEYKRYYNDSVSNIDESLLNNYNALVEKYREYYNTPSTCLNCDYKGVFDNECPQCGSGNVLAGRNLQTIFTPIVGYPALMNAYYNTIDLAWYLKSGLMPSVEMSDTNAEEQAKLLTTSALSPVAVANIDTISLATANSTVLAMAKIIVKSTFKVQVNNSELSEDRKVWTGSFVVTNYSDEEDTAVSEIISIEINGDNETFIKQKIEKSLNKENTDDYSISGLFGKEYDDFCNELKKYALTPLISFHDACQSCIDILMEQGVGDDITDDLYKNLYAPYYNKLMAIEAEIKIREDEINFIVGVYDNEGNLIAKGLQTDIEKCKVQIQNALDFEGYLGEELWLEFCSYRREDRYSNDNYISDGLNNAELFKKALEFIEVAENEIYKSSELQHSISATLNNLLAIPKFKLLVKSFKTGNWIRVRVNEKVYKLRLLEYDISFGDFNNISVEFSDVTKIKNGIADVESIISQASSIASSYDTIKRQSKQGNVARNTIEQWLIDGLDTSLVQIQNNNNEEIIVTKNGLLGRSYSDVTGTYSPEQLKLTHNIMAYTDDDWKTVKQAIGKHSYKFYDKEKSDFVDEIGYGMTAEFVTAGYVSGSQIIGGDIYSDNYSKSDATGSYLNLRDGTFSFGGGSLRYEGGKLLISSPDVPTTETITEINEEYLKATTVYAEGLQVGSANIVGQLTAAQINTEGLIAENISGSTITGKSIIGGSLLIGDKNTDTYAEINTNGKLTCANAEITGVINAKKGGTIAGFTIGDTAIYSGTDSLISSNSGIYLGTDGIRQYSSEDANVTISDGILKAQGANISGDVTANTLIAINGGEISSWVFDSDEMHSKEGIYGTYSYVDTNGRSQTIVGYLFVSLTSDGVWYVIKKENNYLSSNIGDAYIHSIIGINTSDKSKYIKINGGIIET